MVTWVFFGDRRVCSLWGEAVGRLWGDGVRGSGDAFLHSQWIFAAFAYWPFAPARIVLVWGTCVNALLGAVFPVLVYELSSVQALVPL